MNDATATLAALKASQSEQAENQRKEVHNRTCQIEDLQPYKNEAFLRFVDLVGRE